MHPRSILASLTAVFVLTACGTSSPIPEAQPEGASSVAGGSDSTQGDTASNASGEGKKDSNGSGGGTGGAGGSGDPGSDGGFGSGDSGETGESSSGEGPGGGDGSGTGGGSSPRGSGGGALFPASGTYVYSQGGYEEFCAGTCDRQELPPRQSVTSSLTGRGPSSAVVVTNMRASRGRLTRTTTRYSRASADITEVHIKFTYSGYEFNQTYRPKPPVPSLRFPMAKGDRWAAGWTGDVSGDYQASVVGKEAVKVGGRSVQAMRVETTTNFRGDFEGTANATIWVDPKTKAVVRTAGNLSVDSSFGSYSTGFVTTLSSGPGY